MIFNAINKSLRFKIVLTSVVVEVIMLTLLLGNSLRIINIEIDNQSLIKKETTTLLLDAALSIPLFERDSATLTELLDKLIHADKSEFLYIKVFDESGRVFSEKNNFDEHVNLHDNVLHVSSPLTIGNENIGKVSFGMSTQSLHDSKQTLLNQGLLIALVEIILTIILLGVTTYYLTRHIGVLLESAKRISSGHYDVDIPVYSQDEIGRLANEFKSMTNSIKNRIHEISESKKSLNVKTLEFESIFNYLADGIVFVDVDRVCIKVNPAMERMFGYSLNEFTHKKLDFMYLYKSEYDEQSVIRFQKNAKDRDDSFEATFVRKDGTTFIGELLATRVKDRDGKVLGFIGILRDISERILQEEQIRRSLKMNALGKLTGGIAHDYNNMLGVVLGYAELIMSSQKDDPDTAEYAQKIYHAAERGVKLTKKLLSFTKQVSYDIQVINLNTILSDEKNMLEKTLTPRVNLRYEFSDDIWDVNIDKSDFIDAIINLSINSMHAISDSGELIFLTKNKIVRDSEAKILLLKEGDYLCLSITDTGCGMDTETQNKMFEPFYSTKGEMGTGLGLSQVYGFMKRCGGNIAVHSEQGVGTSITLYFPRFINSNSKPTQKFSNEIKDDLSGNESILIVDDEVALANLSAEVFRSHGYKVYSVNNAKDALSLLEKTDIDVMITDILMPEMDGYVLSNLVLQKYPNIKIQLVSGFNGDYNESIRNDDLYNNLLQKPFSVKQLLSKIRRLLL